MSDLSLLLPKYQHLDPSKHSFNEQFGLIRKRTQLQNFLHRLICILTFGIRSDNPSLDRATQKLIRCAEDVLCKSKGNAETMRQLERILRLHLRVVRHNAGTGKTKLWELLSNISSPSACAKSSPVPRQKVVDAAVAMRIAQAEQLAKATRLMQFLEECDMGEKENLTKLPEASEVSALWPRTLALLTSREWPSYRVNQIPSYLVKAAASLRTQPESERRRYLPVIAKLVVLTIPAWQPSNLEDPAWWDLFAQGDCDFQAHTIKEVLYEYLLNGNRTVPYIARLSSASQLAWQKVGGVYSFYVWNYDRMRVVIQGQKPESLIAYLNGLMASTENIDKRYYLTKILGHMIQPHRDAIPVIDDWPLEQFSDQAWELFDCNNLVPNSRNRDYTSLENKDYHWYGLSRHLNHPQTDRQKLFFICFSQQFLKKDPNLLWDASVRSYFEALTPADIAAMPLEKYLPTHRFLLALRSQSLQRYGSVLKSTARNLTAQEMTDLLALCQRYPISLQDKITLVDLLKEPSQPAAAQPAIVQHWTQEISAHMDALLQGFTGLVDSDQWQGAWDFVQGLDELTRNYFIRALRLQTLPAADEVKDLSRPLFLMSLFDSKARGNMCQMLQDGVAGDSFTLWITEMEALSQKAGLPEVIRKTIQDFVKGVKRSAHVGSLKCPLRDQYNNLSLADLTVKLQQDIPAHRVLLRLDPFFNRYISPQSNEVTIPPEKVQEAHLRLKWLYNNLTMREIVQPATQQLLREVKNIKPSFDALFNRSETGADIIVKGVDEPEGIHAHRFLLASAFPFFRGLFETKMRDSATPTVTLQQMTLDQVKVVLEYLYTGERPEFADQQSEVAFKDAWNFLKSKPQ
ncbi:MAG: BTB/POZ domain-containing protein [Parachlamydia sp.]|nr:BTB/POZ domain-containing protein [Parachlamydia sp.]